MPHAVITLAAVKDLSRQHFFVGIEVQHRKMAQPGRGSAAITEVLLSPSDEMEQILSRFDVIPLKKLTE
jgi:hypothetical protein